MTSTPEYDAWHAIIKAELDKPGRCVDLAEFLVEQGIRAGKRSAQCAVSDLRAKRGMPRPPLIEIVDQWAAGRARKLPDWSLGEVKARGDHSAGGVARAASLSRGRRSEIARTGAAATNMIRWSKSSFGKA